MSPTLTAATVPSSSASSSPVPISSRKPARTRKASDKRSATPAMPNAKTAPRGVKTYVLDTSVMIHDPQCLVKFGNNNVGICSESLQELDKLKTENTERGKAARDVQRLMFSLFGADGSMTEGVPTPGGGRLFVSLNRYAVEKSFESEGMRKLFAVCGDMNVIDNRILSNAVYISETTKPPVILVTKDINMHLKARSIGIKAQDYNNDRVERESEDPHRTIPVTCNELQRFASSGELALDQDHGLALNEYVILSDGKTMPARHVGGGKFVRLLGREGVSVPDGIHLRPLNIGQQFLLDAVLNPDITLITVCGQAGTGKTLVTVGAGLSLVSRNSQHHYDGLSITRPVVAMGDGLGFLPGTMEEKMAPWLQPYFDAITFLLSNRGNGKPQSDRKSRKDTEKASAHSGAHNGQVKKPYEKLIEAGMLEIEALCYIRGRSIPNRLFILDEAQQLSPHQAKTVVTRISKGSKLILLGDPAQIDHPYIDAQTNGLVYTRDKLRGQPMAAHITLTKCERSPLAEVAAELM